MKHFPPLRFALERDKTGMAATAQEGTARNRVHRKRGGLTPVARNKVTARKDGTPTPRKRHPITAAKRFARLGPTGFLKTSHLFTVLIGRRVVDTGTNARDARRSFKRWCAFADSGEGIAAHKSVTLTKDGQPIETHKSNQ